MLTRARAAHPYSIFFFFNDTATTEIYTLSLHDALPISGLLPGRHLRGHGLWALAVGARCDDAVGVPGRARPRIAQDRKSTRLNSSHQIISYAVFCLKKKKVSTHHILCTSTRR